MRLLQAAAQRRQRLRRLAQLVVDRAEVEQRERVVRRSASSRFKQRRLRSSLRRAGPDPGSRCGGCHVGPADCAAGLANGRQDLLVDAVAPAHVGAVAEEADVVHDGGRAGGPVGQAQALHGVGGVLVLRGTANRRAAGAVVLVQAVVGVEPEDPLAGRCRRVSLRAAAKSSPGELVHPRAEARAASTVRSFEPVSTTMISSTRSAAAPRQAGRLSSSSLTIMHRDTRIRRARPAAAARRPLPAPFVGAATAGSL